MVAFDPSIGVHRTGLDLLAKGFRAVHILESVFSPALPLSIELNKIGNQVGLIGEDGRHDGTGDGERRHHAVFPAIVIPGLDQLGIEVALADPVGQSMAHDCRREAEAHAPVVLEAQAIGILAVVADLVVAGADNDRLLVEDLVLIHVLEPPEAEVLGAVEPLDEQTRARRLQARHQLDAPPPALVATFVRDVSVAFIVTVHAGTEAGIPAPVAQSVFLDGVVLDREPPLVEIVAGQAVVRRAAAGGIVLLPLRLVGPEIESRRIAFVAVRRTAHVEAVGDPLALGVVDDLPDGVPRVVRNHIPKSSFDGGFRVRMQGLKEDHVPADSGKRVDGFGEVVLILPGSRHLGQRMKELVINAEKLFLNWREVIESKGAHRPCFIPIEGLVAGPVRVVAKVAAAVLDHHPGLLVNPHELRFAGIALAGLQDQGGLEAQGHTLLREICFKVRILDPREESALLMPDKLHGRRGDEGHVVDCLPGWRCKCRRAKKQVLDSKWRGVGNAERAAEESVVARQSVNQVCADGTGPVRPANAELVVKHEAFTARRYSDRLGFAVRKNAPIGLQRKGIRTEGIRFRCQQVLH